jgi:hypothetical protein
MASSGSDREFQSSINCCSNKWNSLFKTVSDEASIKRGRPKLATPFILSQTCDVLSQTCDVACWHKTDLPMQSPHVRCWGNNGSRISVLRLVFRRRLARARGKLEHRRCRALPDLLALLADEPPGEVVHACRRHMRQRAKINIARRLAARTRDLQPREAVVDRLIYCRRWIDGAAVAPHAFVPALTGEVVRFPDQRLWLFPRQRDRICRSAQPNNRTRHGVGVDRYASPVLSRLILAYVEIQNIESFLIPKTELPIRTQTIPRPKTPRPTQAVTAISFESR